MSVLTAPSPEAVAGRRLLSARYHVMEAARILAGGMEPSLHDQLLTVAAELRAREREAAALGESEDE